MIAVQNINKRYGSKIVLDNVNFSAQPGEKIAIIGRNGCGKSTLLKILAGVQKPDTGVIQYYGKEPLKQNKYFGLLCGYVPQDNPLLEELSVKDNLKLWGGRNSLKDKHLLEMFALEEILKTPVHKLSGGMKRRVSIACAISEWPPILIMDEPTNAMDIYYKDMIHTWMDEYVKMNGILVFSTHDESEIEKTKRCLFLNNGIMQDLQGSDKNYSKIQEMIKKG